jgi:hypothetical protein
MAITSSGRRPCDCYIVALETGANATTPTLTGPEDHMKEADMRQFLISGTIAGAALLATFAVDAGGAAQAQPLRYCAHYDWSTINCGFYTQAQCLAAISGTGGRCTLDTYGPLVYGSVHGSDTPAPPRRRYRE